MAKTRVPKTVQELVEDGDEVPKRYIWSESTQSSNYGPPDLTVHSTADIPVIDVGRLISSSEEVINLRSALAQWGCFQAINHGIEKSFMDEVRKISREFFHLPISEKQKYSREGDDYEGYGNDLLLFENQSIDWNDRLYLQVAPQHHQKFKYWPLNPPSLREVLHDYTAKLKHMNEQLLEAITKSLSLPEDSFVSKFGDEQTMYARFNLYPPCPKPDQILGLKPHADGSAITILLQDEQVPGLQIHNDKQWFWVPIVPHALLVNVGDQIEIMSNGIFKSPIHRAVVDSERERSSLAMFCSPDPAKEIEPLDELVDDARPKMFKKVINYPEVYFHYYQQGKRPIDAVRL